MQKIADCVQAIHHDLVAVLVEHARELSSFRGEDAALIDGAKNREAIFDAGEEVITSMARSGVDESGSIFCRHVLGKNAKRVAIEDRVFEHHVVEIDAIEVGDNFVPGPTQLLRYVLNEPVVDDVDHVADLHQGVRQLGMKGDCEIGWNRPGRRGPDDRVDVFEILENLIGIAFQRKANVDRRADMIVVDDLCVGEGGLRGWAPESWAQAFIDEALFGHALECADDLRFKAVVHGCVRLFPKSEHSDSLKLASLDSEIFAGVVSAGAAELPEIFWRS